MTSRRSRHPRRQGRHAGQHHRRRASRSRTARSSRRRRPPCRGTRDARRDRPARAARRDRRACAFPRPRLSAQGGLASGTAAAAFGGVTTVFDMPNTIPPTGTPRSLPPSTRSPPRRRMSTSGSTACSARTTSRTSRSLVAGGVIGFKLYMGNTFGKIPSPSTGAMLEASRSSPRTGKRISLHAETNSIMVRREQRDARGRPRRSAGASRLAAGGGRDRSGEPRGHPRRMDRRAHPHPAHLLGRGTAPAARGQGARRRHHRRDLPALPPARHRGLRPRRRHRRGQPAGARAAQPGAAVGRARRRHHRHDRDRPRAAHAIEEKTRNDIWTVDCGFPASSCRCR